MWQASKALPCRFRNSQIKLDETQSAQTQTLYFLTRRYDIVYCRLRDSDSCRMHLIGSFAEAERLFGLRTGRGLVSKHLQRLKGGSFKPARSLALELGLRGVRVNAVNPSFTFTEMTRSFERHGPLMKKILERVPLGRGAKPAEVASIIAFLASKRVLLKKTITVSIDPRVE
jgi:Enoyl-(Acyl carrier protein) reductase